jgi:hypothetical protein
MSEQINIGDERIILGQELHLAEEAVHVGKQAIHEVLLVRPVYEPQLNDLKAELREARLIRNSVRSDLDVVKASNRPLPDYRWH